MTVSAAKEKLHEFIDHADEKKIFELLSIVQGEGIKSGVQYDEQTLNMLKERSAGYLSGQTATYTTEELKERINRHRKQNGV